MKILVFLTRFPYPLNKGDKLRAFNQIKELSQNNSVCLFALTDKQIKQEDFLIVKQYCEDIHIEKLSLWSVCISLIKCIFTKIPLQVALFTTNGAKRNFIEYLNKINPHTSYFQFVRSGEYAKNIRKITAKSQARLVLDFQDCLSMNISRRAEVSNPFMKMILRQEAARLRIYEDKMFDIFDATTIITTQDRDCMTSKRSKEIFIVENGVDKKYFNYDKSFEKQYDIIFSGNMSYKPNIVAAKYLINEIMPIVWQQNKKVKVCLAGSNPTQEVKSLANDRVIVTGWVDDMREYYAKSVVFVAPMQIGTGLQNKLLEAMAMSLPCVTTVLAYSALKKKQDNCILVSDNTKMLAQHILHLLEDIAFRQEVAINGNSFVKENYLWEKSTANLEKLLKNEI